MTLLDDPAYRHLWIEDVKRNLFDSLYEHLLQDEKQIALLQAFSVYREAVPWHAVHRILQRHTQATEEQTLTALGVLQRYHFIQVQTGSEERYQLHPLLAAFVMTHDLPNERRQIQQSHEEAARYYEDTRGPLAQEEERGSDTLHNLTEAVWHYLQAGQWLQGYALLEQEHLFVDLQLRGKNTVLLELYLLLLPSEQWKPETQQSIRIYNEIGEIYYGLGQKRQAQQYFTKALTLCRTTDERTWEVKVLNNLGSVYRAHGDIPQALQYYQDAKDICIDIPDHPERGITLNNLGRSYQNLGQIERIARKSSKHYREAIKYYEQALATHKTLGDTAEMARTLNNMGEVHQLLKQAESAFSYYQQALRHFRAIDEKRGEGIVCNNLGVLCRQQAKTQLSLEYYIQALHIFRAVGDRWQEGIVLRNIGRLYILLQRQTVALACFLLAKDIYTELRYPERGAIPQELQRFLAGEEALERVMTKVHPQAFNIVEDALQNNDTNLHGD
jgi:tetratricopeptide (TPR) repeat protein